MPNYENELAQIAKEMQATEEALLFAGFSPKHWELIRAYITSALKLNAYLSSHDKPTG
jgi:hypothetical protein